MKRYSLLIAMTLGALAHQYISPFASLIPYLIFLMLLLSYSRLSPSEVKIRRVHILFLLIQVLGSVAIYLLISCFDPIIAQGTMVCVLAPTATAAAVVTGLLGGSIAFVAAYLLLCNLAVAIAAPLIFSFVGQYDNSSFITTFLYICQKVVPLLIAPLLLAWSIRATAPKLHRKVQRLHSFSLYIWAISLAIVTANTVNFIAQQDKGNYTREIIMAIVSLIVCLAQFGIGRKIGVRYGDVISCGQSLGQKNTILAIWMAQTYLNPLASVVPAAYVVWQNLINSWQLWKRK